MNKHHPKKWQNISDNHYPEKDKITPQSPHKDNSNIETTDNQHWYWFLENVNPKKPTVIKRLLKDNRFFKISCVQKTKLFFFNLAKV